MTKPIHVLVGITLFLMSHALAQAGGKESAPSAPFGMASVRLEQNATDRDVEVVFEVEGGDEGLAKLTVVSPDGRKVIDFTAPDAFPLGMRQFHFESPEPKDVKSLKSAYPAGVYTFTGVTAAGIKLHGKSTLSHKLPAAVSFLWPKEGARRVGRKDLEITWTPVKNLVAYVIEIKQEELDVNITARLPSSVAIFAVPEGFLRPGTEYQLGIGTVADEGNISFVETTFTTN